MDMRRRVRRDRLGSMVAEPALGPVAQATLGCALGDVHASRTKRWRRCSLNLTDARAMRIDRGDQRMKSRNVCRSLTV